MQPATHAQTSDISPQTALQSRSFSAPWAVFWIGLAIRVLFVTLAHTWRVSNVQEHFNFGYEMGRIARALATGQGYSNPFNTNSGPTAWEPPLYPLLMAAVFKVFGVYTAVSAWVILSLNSVFSAATALFIYPLAARCYNRKVALWSVWIWALYPAAMQYAVRWIWEMSLTCMLFTAVLALAVTMRGILPREHGPVHGDPGLGEPPSEATQQTPNQTTAQWLLFGLLWALIALCNTTLLAFLPACGLWVLAGAPRKAPAIRRAIASGLVFIALITPWTIRNYRAFHAFVPFRTNFGAELNMGNNSQADGQPWGKTVNGQYQVAEYTRLGELRYSNQQGALAKQWIRNHPRRFVELSLLRFYFFWSTVPHAQTRHWFLVFIRNVNFCVPNILAVLGITLSFRRRNPAAALFAWAFFLLPFMYYFVTPGARFRHPLEPLIVILSVYLLQSAQRSKSGIARSNSLQ